MAKQHRSLRVAALPFSTSLIRAHETHRLDPRCSPPPASPSPAPDLAKTLERTSAKRTDRQFEDTQREVDDVLWYFKLGDVANIDKFEIARSKPRREKNRDRHQRRQRDHLPGLRLLAEEPQRARRRCSSSRTAACTGGSRRTTRTSSARRSSEGFVIVSPEYRGSIGHGVGPLRPDRLRRRGDRRHARRAQLGGREPAVRRPEPRRHLRLEPRRLSRADEHLPVAGRLQGRVRGRAGERPRGAHGLHRPGLPRHLRGVHRQAAGEQRRWSTAAARRSTTPRS